MELLIKKATGEIIAAKADGSPWGKKEKGGDVLDVIKVTEEEYKKITSVCRSNLCAKESMCSDKEVLDSINDGNLKTMVILPLEVKKTTENGEYDIVQSVQISGTKLDSKAAPIKTTKGIAEYDSSAFKNVTKIVEGPVEVFKVSRKKRVLGRASFAAEWRRRSR